MMGDMSTGTCNKGMMTTDKTGMKKTHKGKHHGDHHGAHHPHCSDRKTHHPGCKKEFTEEETKGFGCCDNKEQDVSCPKSKKDCCVEEKTTCTMMGTKTCPMTMEKEACPRGRSMEKEGTCPMKTKTCTKGKETGTDECNMFADDSKKECPMGTTPTPNPKKD